MAELTDKQAATERMRATLCRAKVSFWTATDPETHDTVIVSPDGYSMNGGPMMQVPAWMLEWTPVDLMTGRSGPVPRGMLAERIMTRHQYGLPMELTPEERERLDSQWRN